MSAPVTKTYTVVIATSSNESVVEADQILQLKADFVALVAAYVAKVGSATLTVVSIT